jgi:hypothetical protein
MMMARKWMLCLLFVSSLLFIVGCGQRDDTAEKKDDSVTATGTSMAGARVVRSAQLSVSGAVEGRFDAPDNDATFLIGNCDPEVFANFGIQFSPPGYVWVQVSLLGNPIQPGQTGPVRLDWVQINLVDDEALFFKGPGTLKISLHNALVDDRRMQGVIKTTGLEGFLDAEGQTLDAEFEFDMNFSCGVI